MNMIFHGPENIYMFHTRQGNKCTYKCIHIQHFVPITVHLIKQIFQSKYIKVSHKVCRQCGPYDETEIHTKMSHIQENVSLASGKSDYYQPAPSNLRF